jgi:hypothetical protein
MSVELVSIKKPLPVLGAGLAFRPAYRGQVFRYRSKIDFLEIIADHYMNASPLKKAELALLASHFTLVPHGMNLSLGSACGLDTDYLANLADLVNALNPPWWSEHIAMTRTETIEIGHLTPLPYTWDAIDVVCRNIRTVRQYIQAPLILENITNLVTLPGAEMTEAEFISEILERTDCGLLLDLTNLYTNAVNAEFDPLTYFEKLPLERVVQLHYVGGHQHGDRLLDSHSSSTPPEVWALMTELLERKAPIKGTILERDEQLPPLRELLPELSQARELGRRFGQWT